MNLYVHREFQGKYQLVGALNGKGDAAAFTYSKDYLLNPSSHPISVQLPLQEDPFDATKTAAFFKGLIPEGSLRADIAEAARLNKRDYLGILNQVKNEPIGALLFSDEKELAGIKPSYDGISLDNIKKLAASPTETAFDLTLESRISLAGAQSKIGLYHDGTDPGVGWFLPRGSAPSTHIIKACPKAFPGETICEALCMRAANYMELPSEECFLIPAGNEEPLIAVKRYDRIFESEKSRFVSGLPAPTRLHQEDMCQALGINPDLKYEPSDANYLGLMHSALAGHSSNAMEDRFTLAYYQLFDYAVGNCDNHLKNWSILYSTDWDEIRLSPLYDVLDTTIFPKLSREMGVSFGGSRVIDDSDSKMISDRLSSIGVKGFVAASIFTDMKNELLPSLEKAAEEIADEGFPRAKDILEKMKPGIVERLNKLR